MNHDDRVMHAASKLMTGEDAAAGGCNNDDGNNEQLE